MQKMTEPVNKLCPKCHKDTAVRLVSAAGFQLKGTGWYVTDFKDKGKPKPNPTPENAATPSETATTSDAKKSEVKDKDK